MCHAVCHLDDVHGIYGMRMCAGLPGNHRERGAGGADRVGRVAVYVCICEQRGEEVRR